MRNALLIFSLLLVCMPVKAELNLNYQISEAENNNIYLASAPGSPEGNAKRRAKARRAAREQTVNIEPKVNDKSIWPSILSCSLLGLSYIGDSSGWRLGSTALCGASFIWYTN